MATRNRKKIEKLPPQAFKPKNLVGFRFTMLDEIRMSAAIDQAKRFMNKFGRGRSPYLLDATKYYNTKIDIIG